MAIKPGQLILAGVVGTGVLGVMGKLPASLQATFNGIIGPTATSAKPISNLGPTTQPPISGCDTSFIPGVRYVSAVTGGWVVVIGSKVVYQSASQSDAEQKYNSLVCGG